MQVGVPKERKDAEGRVALTPAGARRLVERGHQVLVEAGAGTASGAPDERYREVGAVVVDDAAEAWAADLVLKVKEPVDDELGRFRPDLTLFTYLHLASAPRLTEALVGSGCVAIAYETVTSPSGGLPLLAPMSRVAGAMAAQVAATECFLPGGGSGVLVGGVPGVPSARAVVLGAGVAGFHAARLLAALGAAVTVLDLDLERLDAVDRALRGRVQTLHSSAAALEEVVPAADVVVGAVLVPGARAPRVLPKELVAQMAPGSVLVDVSIDQGGCADTSRVTTHTEPTYLAEGVLHYCVGNMPGAVPRTSTPALANATIGHVEAIAELGVREAVRADPHLAGGVSVARGRHTHPAVAAAFGTRAAAPLDVL